MANALPTDPVTLILHVRNQAGRVAPLVTSWLKAFRSMSRTVQIIVVDDGSQDTTFEEAQKLEAKEPLLKTLQQTTPLGIGACLRAGLEVATHPLIFIAGSDYPYEPTDAKKLLDAFGIADEITGLTVQVVNGCRRGLAKPPFWACVGRVIRNFFRFGLGNPLEPLPGWLGVGHHAASWVYWLHFGAPFHDPYSRFKLIARELLQRFPIQSDGDFALVEIVAKATFLTTLMTEVPLTEKPDAIPSVQTKSDRRKVANKPKFHNPLRVEPPPMPVELEPQPAEPAPV